MQHPQIVVYEAKCQLAAQIADLAREHRWLVRESRRPEACLEFLREARPAILLLKLERKLTDELTLLARLQERVPDCPVLVFSDVKFDSVEQRTNLAALAYDLGARHVMFPPLERTIIEDLAAGMMEATIRRCNSPGGANA